MAKWAFAINSPLYMNYDGIVVYYHYNPDATHGKMFKNDFSFSYLPKTGLCSDQ